MRTNDDPPVKATTTSTRVLNALIELGEANLTAVKDEVGLSKSSVHNHLETLKHLGFVLKEDQKYRLSLRFFEIGSSVRSELPLYQVGRNEVDRLAQTSGLAAGLTIFERNTGICLYETSGQKVEKAPIMEGETVPLHCTAPGKAMLVNLPDEDLEPVLNAQVTESFTAHTITDLTQLREELKTAQTRGLASEREEWRTNLRGLAAGITDSERRTFGAIYVLSPSESMSGKRFQQDIPGLIISSANQIRKGLRNPS